MSRFLGHQSRDARILETVDTLGFGDDGTTFKVRSDGVVHHQDANVHNAVAGIGTTVVSNGYAAIGVHMIGPNAIADQGGTRTLYRVMANGFAHSTSFSVGCGFGRSPTTPSDEAAGEEITKKVFLAGGVQNLSYDDLIGVDPFPDADKALAICFFVFVKNNGSSSARVKTEVNLSVARLVGPRPMMHDQRIQ